MMSIGPSEKFASASRPGTHHKILVSDQLGRDERYVISFAVYMYVSSLRIEFPNNSWINQSFQRNIGSAQTGAL